MTARPQMPPARRRPIPGMAVTRSRRPTAEPAAPSCGTPSDGTASRRTARRWVRRRRQREPAVDAAAAAGGGLRRDAAGELPASCRLARSFQALVREAEG